MAVEAAQMLAAMEHAGMRMTRPRQTIVEQVAAWAHEGADFTADALWHAAQALEPCVSRATAFRTVDVLAELGFLDRVSFADGSEHYHVAEPGTHHHHLTCEQCHRVVAINVCVAPEQLAHVASATGFALSSHRVELFGRCPACQAARA
jgi:Fur family transcriptional regulator, ferric uptake regulator